MHSQRPNHRANERQSRAITSTHLHQNNASEPSLNSPLPKNNGTVLRAYDTISKRICVYEKNRSENNTKKCPRIKAKEKTLTLGQFVGTRMGGVLPQYVVT